MFLTLCIGFVAAYVVSAVLIPVILRFSNRFSLYDCPESKEIHNPTSGRQRIHKKPISRLGGLAIFVGFLSSFLILGGYTHHIWPLILSVPIFFAGLVDDVRPLRPMYRLIIQTLCAVAAVYLGNLCITQISLTPFQATPIPVAIGFPLSVFVIVGAINAINMIDGLDGLAGGVALIGIVLLSFAYFLTTQRIEIIAYWAMPILGAIAGFLRYNTHPASIFMGDGGSNWIGYMAGIIMLIVLAGSRTEGPEYLAVAITPGPYVPLLSAVLCLAIPVFDTSCVMIMRMLRGQSPMVADNRHFHHTLLAIGFSHRETVMAVYFIATMAGVFGLLPVLYLSYNFWLAPYIVAIAVAVIIPLSISFDRCLIDWILPRHREEDLTLSKTQGRLDSFIRTWGSVNRLCLYVILLVSPIFAGNIKPEVGFAAAVGFVFVLTAGIIFRGANDFSESITIAIAATIILVANNMNPITVEWLGEKISVQSIYNGLFLFLLVSVLSFLFVTMNRRYVILNPSDFLLLILPLLLLLFPEPIKSEFRLHIISLRCQVIFMTLRSLQVTTPGAMHSLRATVGASLLLVFLISVFKLKVGH